MLAAVLAAALAIRIWVVLVDRSLYHPDEIYQSMEVAHRLVFGYGLRAWEWVEGARFPLLAWLVAAPMELTHLLGVDTPSVYVTLTYGLVALASVLGGYGVYRLARSQGAGEAAATLGCAVFLLAPGVVFLSHRALAGVVSAPAIVWGMRWALPDDVGRRGRLGGYALLAFATLLRLQNGLFCVALLVILLARRRRRHAAEALAVFVAGAFVYGAVDWIVWGFPFHSALAYLYFNVVLGKSARYGTQPPWYYATLLFRAFGPLGAAWLAVAFVGWRRARGLAAMVLVFGGLFALIPHKEFRFLFPVLPLWCALGAVGVEQVGARRAPDEGGRRLSAVSALAVVALLGWFGVSFPRLTLEDVGRGALRVLPHVRGTARFDQDIDRLLIDLHDQADLCGLRIEGRPVWYTGGYTFLHRDVPIYWSSYEPGFDQTQYNYVIAPLESRTEAPLERRGDFGLWKTGRTHCANADAYKPRLRLDKQLTGFGW